MVVAIGSSADFTLENYRAIAWAGQAPQFTPAALQRIGECRAAFLKLIDSDPDLTIYGVTSGYGQHAKKRLTPEERKLHAKKPPYAAAVAFGPSLPARVTRGFVFARLANFVEGHAAVSPELAAATAAMLNGQKLPKVSAMGQGGAGEILGLSPLFVALCERFDLGEKEMLSLINGSPCAASLLSDAVLAMERRLPLVEQAFALSAEAILTPTEHFAPEFERLWGDPHEAAALQSLRGLIAGGAAKRRPYQAPVSYRILPRVIGQFRRALAQARDIAERSLRAVTDNPVFLPPDALHPQGRVYSTGGYHNAAAYPALDNLAAAVADLCILADKHITKLFDGSVSLLPHELIAGEGYLGCLGMVQVGYAEEARRAAQRTFLPGSEDGGFGQNDTAPPTFIAWRGQEQAGYCLDAALASLAVTASQALHATQRAAPPALRPFLAQVRDHMPPMTGPRAAASDMDRLHAALRSRVYDVAAAVGD